MYKKENIFCKVILFGEQSSGKGKIKENFLNNNEEIKNSFNASSGIRTIKELGEDVQFELWDTPGNKRYISNMVKPLLNNANVAILVYDVRDKSTFNEIKYFWYNYIKDYAPKDISK